MFSVRLFINRLFSNLLYQGSTWHPLTGLSENRTYLALYVGAPPLRLWQAQREMSSLDPASQGHGLLISEVMTFDCIIDRPRLSRRQV